MVHGGALGILWYLVGRGKQCKHAYALAWRVTTTMRALLRLPNLETLDHSNRWGAVLMGGRDRDLSCLERRRTLPFRFFRGDKRTPALMDTCKFYEWSSFYVNYMQYAVCRIPNVFVR